MPATWSRDSTQSQRCSVVLPSYASTRVIGDVTTSASPRAARSSRAIIFRYAGGAAPLVFGVEILQLVEGCHPLVLSHGAVFFLQPVDQFSLPVRRGRRLDGQAAVAGRGLPWKTWLLCQERWIVATG